MADIQINKIPFETGVNDGSFFVFDKEISGQYVTNKISWSDMLNEINQYDKNIGNSDLTVALNPGETGRVLDLGDSEFFEIRRQQETVQGDVDSVFTNSYSENGDIELVQQAMRLAPNFVADNFSEFLLTYTLDNDDMSYSSDSIIRNKNVNQYTDEEYLSNITSQADSSNARTQMGSTYTQPSETTTSSFNTRPYSIGMYSNLEDYMGNYKITDFSLSSHEMYFNSLHDDGVNFFENYMIFNTDIFVISGFHTFAVDGGFQLGNDVITYDDIYGLKFRDIEFNSITFQFDGVNTTFEIPHSLGVEPSFYSLTSSDTTNSDFNSYVVTKDSSKITIECATPPTGSDITMFYIIKK